MNTYDLITLLFAIIILPSYIFYLYLRRKEDREEQNELNTSEKILSALKEYAKQQPDFAQILHKFGLL